jgi:hypothetical protein
MSPLGCGFQPSGVMRVYAEGVTRMNLVSSEEGRRRTGVQQPLSQSMMMMIMISLFGQLGL